MRKRNWKKLLIPNIPYLFIALFATKIGQAIRLAPGMDFSGKALHMMEGIRDNHTQVRNTKAYLLAALFNAVSTLDSYYTMQANSAFGGSF